MESSEAVMAPRVRAKIFFVPGRGWYLITRDGRFGPFFLRTQAELELERVLRLRQIREESLTARNRTNRPSRAVDETALRT